ETAKVGLSPDIAWMQPNSLMMDSPVPILFVHEGKNRKAWQQLPQFWNVSQLPPRPHLPIAMFGGSPLLAAGLVVAGPADRAIKINVPLGLDDPTPNIPAANPPTLAKWELGKRLFFDRDNLLPADSRQNKVSCATCHDPGHGFTSRRLIRPN